MQDHFQLQLQEWKTQIDGRLRHLVEVQEPPILYKPIQYVLDGGGKRIRPLLLLMACEAVGGRPDQAWDAALAVELLHNFTLVHDDIMDADDIRRGRATVHKQWSPDIALLAGDGIFALAYQTLLKTKSNKIQQILNLFTNGVLGVCEGQAMDLSLENGHTASLTDYLEMIGKKTATLLKMSAQIGAVVGGGSEHEVEALGQYGYNVGLAFQVQDDLLDIVSDEATLGKSHGSDVRQKKQTYLLIHALANAGQEDRARLSELMNGASGTGKIDEVKKIFEQSGSIQAAQDAASKYLSAAKDCLSILTQNQGKEFFLKLLSFISNRKA